MTFHHSQGAVPRQTAVPWPSDTFEEWHGRQGFAGDYSVLHRRNPTTKWLRVTGPLRNRAVFTPQLATADLEDPRALPTVLLENADITVGVSRRTEPMPFYVRNLDADTVYLTLEGSGRFVTDYGILQYGPMEYIVIPKATNYRVVPDAGNQLAFVFETFKPLGVSDRTNLGPFLPFDLDVLDVPQLDASALGDAVPSAANDQGEWEVLVKRGAEFSSIFYGFDPMDVVGWKGSLTPFRLRISDIRPLTAERMEVLPVIHSTFRSEGTVFCTFGPRPSQSPSEAAAYPPYHRNADYDELLVFLRPEDESTPGLPPTGLMTLTAGGMNHGPAAQQLAHPFARFPTYLLNLDAERPLRATAAFEASEIPDYDQMEKFDTAPVG